MTRNPLSLPKPGFPARRCWLAGKTVLVAFLLAACSAPASEVGGVTVSAATSSVPRGGESYQVDYRVTPDPDAGGAWIEMEVSQPRALLRSVDMRQQLIDAQSVTGDGDVAIGNERIKWTPPATGGSLTWFIPIDHVRSNGRYDAHINADWALFRASDVFPPARTRALQGARSRTFLSFDLPRGWSSVTPYKGEKHRYPVDNPNRLFDRPNGWFLLGKFGRRNEIVSERRVVVAGPTGHAVRRMDILALLRWTLPELSNLLPSAPERITVISAGEPMWRGGLSAPNSLFLHADRPLISENGTSTLVHELMHVATGLRGAPGADWIVEGLAEYYSLELLRRSGTISAKRFETALESLAEWGKEAKALCTERASGPITARAVTVFSRLDNELRRKSDTDLDAVLRKLVTHDRDIGIADLQSITRELAGSLPEAIQSKNLPGCGS